MGMGGFSSNQEASAAYYNQVYAPQATALAQAQVLQRTTVEGSFVSPSGGGASATINGLGRSDASLVLGSPGGGVALKYLLVGDPDANVPITIGGSMPTLIVPGMTLEVSGGRNDQGKFNIQIGLGAGTPRAGAKCELNGSYSPLPTIPLSKGLNIEALKPVGASK